VVEQHGVKCPLLLQDDRAILDMWSIFFTFSTLLYIKWAFKPGKSSNGNPRAGWLAGPPIQEVWLLTQPAPSQQPCGLEDIPQLCH
jgi:hypothetical protein